jgi:predicted MFS family arabinose efflux permease
MKDLSRRPWYPWLVVFLLWVVAMLNYLDRLMIASMRDPIKASIPMTEAQFGLLTTIFLVIYGVLSPLGGYLSDRFNRKIVILFSLLTWSAVTVWTGLVHTYGEMLTARAFMGISEACFIPAALAMVVEYHPGSTRSLASGILYSGTYAGMALGGLGGYIAESWGWRAGFHLFGIVGILYAVILVLFLRNVPRRKEETTMEIKETKHVKFTEVLKNLYSSVNYWLIILYSLLLGITLWLIYAWLPTFFREGFHLSLGRAGLSATAYIQVAAFLGILIGGTIADRWSRKNRKARFLVPAIAFLVGGPFLYLMASTKIFVIAIIGITIFGLSKGFHDANYMPMVAQIVDKRYLATGYGMLTFFSVLAGGAMIYVGGLLRDAGVSLSFVFMLSALGVILSALILLVIKPKYDS